MEKLRKLEKSRKCASIMAWHLLRSSAKSNRDPFKSSQDPVAHTRSCIRSSVTGKGVG